MACGCPRRYTHDSCPNFKAWYTACMVHTMEVPGKYEALVAKRPLPEEALTDMETDVTRTCTSRAYFAHLEGRQHLRSVLTAWIAYDAMSDVPIGYVQGMNFLAAHLVYHSPSPKDAFWLFISMMQFHDFKCMFEEGLLGLRKRCFIMRKLIATHLPEIFAQFEKYNIVHSLDLAFSEWLLTVFSSCVPLGSLTAIWNDFFLESWVSVYRLVLARLRALQPVLLREKDYGTLMQVIKWGHPNLKTNELKYFCHDQSWTCSVCNHSEDCVSWSQLLSEAQHTRGNIGNTEIMCYEVAFAASQTTLPPATTPEHQTTQDDENGLHERQSIPTVCQSFDLFTPPASRQPSPSGTLVDDVTGRSDDNHPPFMLVRNMMEDHTTPRRGQPGSPVERAIAQPPASRSVTIWNSSAAVASGMNAAPATGTNECGRPPPLQNAKYTRGETDMHEGRTAAELAAILCDVQAQLTAERQRNEALEHDNRRLQLALEVERNAV